MTQAPLLDNLVTRHGYPLLDAAGVESFLAEGGVCVLFFAGDPAKYPETLDLAVILPEVMERFVGRCRAALVAPQAEAALQQRFGFRVWPALVFLRGDAYLGVIERVRNWADYLDEFKRLLAAGPGRPPTLGIPVTAGSQPAYG